MSRLSHSHVTVNKRTTCIGGESHEWKEARIRGNRVRLLCTKCRSYTAWVPRTNGSSIPSQKRAAANDSPKAFRPKTLNDFGFTKDDRGWLDAHTADELRQIAKEKGMKGYSKLAKADLVEALAS